LDRPDFQEFYNGGNKIYFDQSDRIKKSLYSFVENEHSLDGSAIMDFWFPKAKADIFISHSSVDLTSAIVLAGMIKAIFNLDSFVDQSAWGHIDDLQKEVDNEHCLLDSGNYDYNLRNHSTSHVHAMLVSALSVMIDKSECMFFLNTPRSISSYRNTDKTKSPWLYLELTISKLIEKKLPLRPLTEHMSHFEGPKIRKGFVMTHEVNLGHLASLTQDDLFVWLNQRSQVEHPLDTLYRIYPQKNKSN